MSLLLQILLNLFSFWNTGASAEIPCYTASAWPEADALFRRDPHWIGGDVASTVDLGGGRTLWLFGDTWIDPTGRRDRRSARMINNSVAIQTGDDPTTATIRYVWGRRSDGTPEAVFPYRDSTWLWFGAGSRISDRLVLFLGKTIASPGTGLGFASAGWTAYLVDNPDDDPSNWRSRELATTPNQLGVVVGFACLVQQDGYLIALGALDPVKTLPIYAVRWPLERVQRGDLLAPEWWTGERTGWVPDASTQPRWPIFEHGQSELTVHRDPASGQYLAVQSVGFGATDVAMRSAPSLTGPWSWPKVVYRPPEFTRPNVMIYAAKAHPHLTGADLVVTYATNTFVFSEHLTDSLIYYPRFVRLTQCP